MKNKIHVKWHVLTGGFIGYMFDAMDILLLAVSLPVIRKDLSLSLSEGGMLVTATLVGIGLSSFIVGWMADNFGRRKTLIMSLVSFGVLTMAIAYANTWLQILILRFLAGLGLGGVWSIIVAYIAETWPAHQRGRAASFVMSSFPVGAGLAAFLANIILPTYGWRALFLCGGGAIVAAVYIYFFVPESQVWLDEKAKGISKTKDGNTKVSIGEIFAPEFIKNTIFATLAASFGLFAYWGSTTWLPTFLVDVRGLNIGKMTFSVVVLNIGMFLGYNVFGMLADKLGRKKAIIISFIGTAITLPIYISMTNHTALLLLGPVYAFFIAFVGLFGSYFPELYPTRIRATGAGFCFNVGRGLSALAPVLLGYFAKQYGMTGGIILCAVFFALAAVAMFFLPDTANKAQ